MSRSLPIGTLSMVEQFTQRTVVVAPVDELAIWGFDESSFAFEHRGHPQETATVVGEDEHLSVKHKYIDGVTRHKERLQRRVNIPYPSSVSTLIVAGE